MMIIVIANLMIMMDIMLRLAQSVWELVSVVYPHVPTKLPNGQLWAYKAQG
jgi:hypothetical protein